MSDVRAVFYGDDFTGSVDALLQFARHGWTGRLFVGLPPSGELEDAAASSDVVGIAGIARSLPTGDLEAELRPALDRLVALRPRLVQYKACSTADSSPDIGSLGRVIEIGREAVEVAAVTGAGTGAASRVVPLLFAQPDFGRYTAFGHHFAAERGIVHRLDRQPTMSTHPATPMTESDLAVHLGRQTALPIGSLPFTAYASADSVTEALRRTDEAAVVLDALSPEHLELIGAALARLERPVFAIGSGGLSWGIGAADPRKAPALPTASTLGGPVLAVSGSRSPATRRQADAAAAAGWLVRPLDLGSDPASGAGSAGPAAIADVLDALAAGRSVVLTSDDAAAPAAAGGAGSPDVLAAIAAAAASVVDRAVRTGVTRRIVVCGGDTSSRVTRLLGATSLSIAANPWANIVLLRAHAADPAVDGIELLLKGGQVGDDDLFTRIL